MTMSMIQYIGQVNATPTEVIMHLQKSRQSDSTQKLPENLMLDFLENEIGISNLANIIKVKSNYLWSRSDVERYRINVYTEIKQNKEDYYHKNIIGYSFFIHYDKDANVILNKTER